MIFMKYFYSYNIDAARCDCGSSTIEHQEVVKKVEDKTKKNLNSMNGNLKNLFNEDEKEEETVSKEDIIKEGVIWTY